MGEIADDMINGFQCSDCGTCFEEEHGYPVVCSSCWSELLKDAIKNPKDHDIMREKGKIILIDGVQKAIYGEL